MSLAASQTPHMTMFGPPLPLGIREFNRRQVHEPGCPNCLEKDYCDCPWRADDASDPQNQITDHFPYCNNAADCGLCFCPSRTRPLTPPLVPPDRPGYSSPSVSPIEVVTPSPPRGPAWQRRLGVLVVEDDFEVDDIRQQIWLQQAADELERLLRETRSL
ncbi:hypothetical protein BDP81DRAFT_417952 [Colletotrichum phormii]|uniref:Uncharacterized protein n=1 Tax=Colletotrichum phormii TaxID=359342 RepID=A0AAJ0A089_9PEZI|nr:uncharacterized protein BDP81DRAFT_417952 [Colletotrichum phormii]KAK1641055.1 hypothetical protein BDP81DRAFT_417952 [Colletotrichum phormii]